jgi:hypothetical protein
MGLFDNLKDQLSDAVGARTLPTPPSRSATPRTCSPASKAGTGTTRAARGAGRTPANSRWWLQAPPRGEAMRATIDDDVSKATPPNTGRLRPRTWRTVVLLAVALALGAVEVLARAGAFQAQLEIVQYGWSGEYVDADGQTHPALTGMPRPARMSSQFGLTNIGTTEVRVLDVRIDADGVEFVQARVGDAHRGSDGVYRSGGRVLRPDEPERLEPDATARIAVEVRITDCGTAGSPVALVTVESWRGRQTVRLTTPHVRTVDGGYRVTTPDDPFAVNGVRYLAERACEAGR